MSIPSESAPSSSTELLPRPSRLGRFWRAARGTVIPTATFLALIALWEAGVRLFDIPSFLLPGPSAVIAAGTGLPLAQWFAHTVATLEIVLGGYALSILVSVPLGILIASSRPIAEALYPLLVVTQSLPVVAVAPVIIVILGAGELPRLVITFLIAFFPIVISTVTGLRATPPELVELSRSLRAGAARELWQIRLPWAVPYLFAALKVSITLAVIGAVVAEFVAAEQGLGYLIKFSTSYFKVPLAFAGLAVLAALSLLLFQMVVWVEKTVFPWAVPRQDDR